MKAPVEVGQHLDLQIESLSGFENGVGRHNGFVVFVPFTAPQEKVRVRITEVKKNYCHGEVVEVLSPSPFRVEPPCPYFGECGGCAWQHVQYEEQLRQKELRVLSAIKYLKTEVTLQPIIPSPSPWRYRNRIQVRKLGKNVGFFKRKSNKIVAIKDCLIADERICHEMTNLPMGKSTEPAKYELAVTPEGNVSITKDQSHGENLGFAQVNTIQNENLIQLILDIVKPLNSKKFLELYCGNGNISFPVIKKIRPQSFYGSDLSAKSIEQAQSKAKALNSPSEIHFYCEDATETFHKFPTLENTTVILDPPRVGCDKKVMASLSRLKPQNILYISCDPMTWSRDIQWLRNLTDYTVDLVQPLDMFPQTDHVELISLLTLR